ncbi:MAG TPA: nitroreductase family deazaflavin-dependent oxidoreductase [Candidatus Bathyarchaeia archaeon]|nr:nitroreductase family deazaflavin-dependent oxidoreductase [Candidatus Bathyarchaeia archaeon]
MKGQRLFSRTHVSFYRVSRGRIGGRLWNAPVLLLTTIGRRAGKKRTTPLLYLRDGERIIIVASNSGSDREPSWWTNLRHDPHAEVQIKGRKKTMIGRKASEEEKSDFWPLLTEMYPAYGDYQLKTKREIPVVILTEDNG